MTQHTLNLSGLYECVCRDARGRVLWRESAQNGMLVPGITDVLSAAFNGGTQRTWYMGVIDNTNFDGLDADDTLASNEWDEFTSYSGNRQQWSTLSSAGGVIYNTSPAQFVFTANGTVRGMFLATSATKGETASILFSTAEFSTTRTVVAGASLTVTYSIRGAGGN